MTTWHDIGGPDTNLMEPDSDDWPEDAGCKFPCGQEPMSCPTCPDLGRTTPPPTKYDYMERMHDLERKGYSPEEIDDIMTGGW